MKMNRIALAALIAFTAACSKTSTAPSAPDPNTYKFTASLSPNNENPPIVNEDKTGSGTATMTFIVTKNSDGSIASATVTFDVNLSGFPAGTTLTGAHIHEAAPGINGAIKVQTTLGNGEVVLASGSGSFTKTTAAPADVTQGIINNPNGYYFNVHTKINGGGAARGQLVRQ